MDAQSIAPSISDIVKALAPAFVAGFAVQQGVEVVSSLCAQAVKDWEKNISKKKAILTLVSLAISAWVVAFAKLDVMQVFAASKNCEAPFTHGLVTVIFISAGTEGFNSLLKWISYKKEDAKASAAGTKQTVTTNAPDAMKQMPS